MLYSGRFYNSVNVHCLLLALIDNSVGCVVSNERRWDSCEFRRGNIVRRSGPGLFVYVVFIQMHELKVCKGAPVHKLVRLFACFVSKKVPNGFRQNLVLGPILNVTRRTFFFV
jgi:hypothetical protein